MEVMKSLKQDWPLWIAMSMLFAMFLKVCVEMSRDIACRMT